jgi:hypothetical protein
MHTFTITIKSAQGGQLHRSFTGIYPSAIDAVMDAIDIAPPFSCISVIAQRAAS